MMLPTHALAGMALALPVAHAAPRFGGVALVAGLVGGIVPDLDLYVGHRRTLHYPVYYSALALVAVPAALLVPTTATVVAALFLLGAATHCVADVFGGGLELRPWEATSDRAVYDHHHGAWLAPRRWVRYDGSPEDFLLAVALATPLLAVVDGSLRPIVMAALAVAAVYTVVRRVLPSVVRLVVAGVLAPTLPDRALARVPDRYLNDGDRPNGGDRPSAVVTDGR